MHTNNYEGGWGWGWGWGEGGAPDAKPGLRSIDDKSKRVHFLSNDKLVPTQAVAQLPCCLQGPRMTHISHETVLGDAQLY